MAAAAAVIRVAGQGTALGAAGIVAVVFGAAAAAAVMCVAVVVGGAGAVVGAPAAAAAAVAENVSASVPPVHSSPHCHYLRATAAAHERECALPRPLAPCVAHSHVHARSPLLPLPLPLPVLCGTHAPGGDPCQGRSLLHLCVSACVVCVGVRECTSACACVCSAYVRLHVCVRACMRMCRCVYAPGCGLCRYVLIRLYLLCVRATGGGP